MDPSNIAPSQSAALQGFFTGSKTLHEVAAELTSLSLFEDLRPESGLSRLWGVILDIARDSCAHHDKLVEVLVYLSKMPSPKSDEGTAFIVHKMQVWKDLPMLAWAFRDEWNALAVPLDATGSLEDHQAEAQGYININKFAASLMASEQEVFTFDMFALWTFRDALETPQTADLLNACIPAAAAWIEVFGVGILRWDKEFPSGFPYGAPGRGGPLWHGKHGFCEERWTLWKERFGELAGRQDLTSDTRKMAEEASIMMREIQNGEVC